jgi:hypothetical protein
LLEIRTYRLKPGTLEAFHAAMRDVSAPMLRRRGMDVVAYGRSNHEEESYFLVRAYKDRAALESEQLAFYSSTEWKLARMFHQVRARVGGYAVRWQGVTTLRARAREEEQRSQRAAAPLNRVRSARNKLDLALEAKKVSIHAVLRDIRERPGEISGLGPRAMLVDKIDTYVNTLLWCSEDGVEAMRRLNAPEAT